MPVCPKRQDVPVNGMHVAARRAGPKLQQPLRPKRLHFQGCVHDERRGVCGRPHEMGRAAHLPTVAILDGTQHEVQFLLLSLLLLAVAVVVLVLVPL